MRFKFTFILTFVLQHIFGNAFGHDIYKYKIDKLALIIQIIGFTSTKFIKRLQLILSVIVVYLLTRMQISSS